MCVIVDEYRKDNDWVEVSRDQLKPGKTYYIKDGVYSNPDQIVFRIKRKDL